MRCFENIIEAQCMSTPTRNIFSSNRFYTVCLFHHITTISSTECFLDSMINVAVVVSRADIEQANHDKCNARPKYIELLIRRVDRGEKHIRLSCLHLFGHLLD